MPSSIHKSRCEPGFTFIEKAVREDIDGLYALLEEAKKNMLNKSIDD